MTKNNVVVSLKQERWPQSFWKPLTVSVKGFNRTAREMITLLLTYILCTKSIFYKLWYLQWRPLCVFNSAECDPAVIYSAVTNEDISYGQITIRPNRPRGKAALYSLIKKISLLPEREALLFENMSQDNTRNLRFKEANRKSGSYTSGGKTMHNLYSNKSFHNKLLSCSTILRLHGCLSVFVTISMICQHI